MDMAFGSMILGKIMEVFAITAINDGKKKKTAKRVGLNKYHSWTKEEDAALVQSLSEMAEDKKWKADN